MSIKDIYSNRFENLVIWSGSSEMPAGKTLDIDATDRNLKAEMDRKDAEWLEANPEPDRESDEYLEWEDAQRSAHDQMCVRLLRSSEWYENAYVWVDVEVEA